MTKREKHALLARRLRNKAERGRKSGLKDFKGDTSMLEAVNTTYDDLMEIAKFLRMGRVEKAAELMLDLDTFAREELPQSVWDYLNKAYFGEEYS